MNRSFVSLLTAFSFAVLAVTGVLAFALPFSIRVVALHALMGFVFVGLVGWHVANNSDKLSRYLRRRVAWVTLGIALGLTALFLWQPGPVRGILGLSRNLGPALDRFEVGDGGLVYHYSPAPHYRIALEIRAGETFDPASPPRVAIWLENASFYHIVTLRAPESGDGEGLPYWDFKRRGWEEAKREAEESGRDLAEEAGIDAVSGATRNSSFDPADYILPADPGNPMPFRLLVEIDQAGDGLPSLVYSVEIDNLDPRVFQLLELSGYPKREEEGEDGDEEWALYFVDYADERFAPLLQVIDSALLTIERGGEE